MLKPCGPHRISLPSGHTSKYTTHKKKQHILQEKMEALRLYCNAIRADRRKGGGKEMQKRNECRNDSTEEPLCGSPNYLMGLDDQEKQRNIMSCKVMTCLKTTFIFWKENCPPSSHREKENE